MRPACHLGSYRCELDEFGRKYANRAEAEFSGQFKIIPKWPWLATRTASCDQSHFHILQKLITRWSVRAKERMDDVRRATEKFEWGITTEGAENGMGLLGGLGLARQFFHVKGNTLKMCPAWNWGNPSQNFRHLSQRPAAATMFQDAARSVLLAKQLGPCVHPLHTPCRNFRPYCSDGPDCLCRCL